MRRKVEEGAQWSGPRKDNQAQTEEVQKEVKTYAEVSAQTVPLLLLIGGKGVRNKQNVDMANYPLYEDMPGHEDEVDEVLVVPQATYNNTIQQVVFWDLRSKVASQPFTEGRKDHQFNGT